MLTGGFRSFDFCNQVLADKELDFIGMARPFLTNLEEIPAFLDKEIEKLEDLVVRTGIRALDSASEGGFYAKQLLRIAEGKAVDLKMGAFSSVMFLTLYEWRQSLRNRI